MNSAELYHTKTGPVIIMGNGPSLNDIPDGFLVKYPTFGCNTIHLRQGFKPSYWAAADRWVTSWIDVILDRFADIPKFYMSPTHRAERERYQRDGCLVGPGGIQMSPERSAKFYAYIRAPNPVVMYPEKMGPNYLSDPGISFMGITHAMIQIAVFMGHDRFYLVGCDNTGTGEHFYNDKLNDYGVMPGQWEWAFDTLQMSIKPMPIINLSTRGKIQCLPWADWKNL